MAAYIPPGWPTGVHPPDSRDFETTAVAWLLDVVPPDFRLHGVLRRHPAALAAMARHHTQACVEGARAGYRTTRTELGEAIPPHAVDAVLAAYRTEGAGWPPPRGPSPSSSARCTGSPSRRSSSREPGGPGWGCGKN